jgi:hypothetical protein
MEHATGPGRHASVERLTDIEASKTHTADSPAVVAGFFSAGTTHIRCAGAAFWSDGTVSPWAGSKARGGPSTVTGGDEPQGAGRRFIHTITVEQSHTMHGKTVDKWDYYGEVTVSGQQRRSSRAGGPVAGKAVIRTYRNGSIARAARAKSSLTC